MSITINVNGQLHAVEAEPDTSLLWVVRDILGLTGTKFGCGMGLCGACTVHVDGQAVRSCLTPISSLAGKQVTTIEAVGESAVGSAVKNAWIDLDVVQCGYCQPGQIMSACSFLKTNPNPSDEEINAAMAGNICRCGTYVRIKAAVKQAAGDLQSTGLKG